MPRPPFEFNAWAVRVRPDHPSLSPHLEGILLGRYYFDRTINMPPALEGCRVALFTTRAIARLYARPLTVKRKGDGWRPWRTATPVRVRVRIALARAE